MRAAFFDLDKTVIAKASIAAFGRPLYRGGLINRRLVARALGLPAHLPPPGGERAEAGQGARVDADPDQGVGPGPDPGDRARGAGGDGGADHLRRGARPHRGAPGRRLQGVPGLGITRGHRAPPGRTPGRRRGHRQPGGGGRGGPVRRRDGVLRLRSVQGRGHAGARRDRGIRPGGVVGLLRLLHRHPHARGGRPPRGREPRPGAGQGGQRTGVGGHAVHQADPAPRPGQRAPAVDHHRRRRRHGRGLGGRAGGLAVGPPRRP